MNVGQYRRNIALRHSPPSCLLAQTMPAFKLGLHLIYTPNITRNNFAMGSHQPRCPDKVFRTAFMLVLCVKVVSRTTFYHADCQPMQSRLIIM